MHYPIIKFKEVPLAADVLTELFRTELEGPKGDEVAVQLTNTGANPLTDFQAEVRVLGDEFNGVWEPYLAGADWALLTNGDQRGWTSTNVPNTLAAGANSITVTKVRQYREVRFLAKSLLGTTVKVGAEGSYIGGGGR